MTPTQLTFVETFVAFLAACVLSFWFGRISRDKEVEKVREMAKERADTLSQNRDDWHDRARAAEAQLASLPKRGLGGKFEKRGA